MNKSFTINSPGFVPYVIACSRSWGHHWVRRWGKQWWRHSWTPQQWGKSGRTGCHCVCSKHLCAYSPWTRLPVKHLNRLKHFTIHVVSFLFLAKVHFIGLLKCSYIGLIVVVALLLLWCSGLNHWTGKMKVAGSISAAITNSVIQQGFFLQG